MGRVRNSYLWKLLNDGPSAKQTEFFLWTLALLAALVVLIWAVIRIRARFRDDDDPAAIDRSMLLGLGELHREGDLSESEYRSIKSQLIQRMEETPAHGSENQS